MDNDSFIDSLLESFATADDSDQNEEPSQAQSSTQISTDDDELRKVTIDGKIYVESKDLLKILPLNHGTF